MAEGGEEVVTTSAENSLTLVKYNNPVLVIKHPEKPVEKVIFFLIILK